MLGMYPTFYVPYIGSAWVMGIIGVIHVVASHTSVEAAFLFAVLETKAYRDNQPEIMSFIKRYGVFLLVFSYVSLNHRPRHWYAITVASPRGVSGLIHNFVWVWAAEWVYFTVEGDRRPRARLSHRQDRRAHPPQAYLVLRARCSSPPYDGMVDV